MGDEKVDIDKIIKTIPNPILKWVGGKNQIIKILLDKLPKKINNYYELFLGGGSVLLLILWANNNNIINVKKSINAYDKNEALIGMYNNIKNNKEKLYDKIKEIIDIYHECKDDKNNNRKPKNIDEAKSSKESYYYWIRQLFNKENDKNSIITSAYFIFLNKTGFRGMYREGPNGFNIPYGNYKNPKIINKDELYNISELIKNVNFMCCDFTEGFKNIKNNKNNFIYLDPPYAPENNKSFVGYNKNGFNIEQHELLFNLINKFSKTNNIMVSNSNVQLVRDNLLEENYNYEIIECRRAINSKDPSAKTEEVIITNYKN